MIVFSSLRLALVGITLCSIAPSLVRAQVAIHRSPVVAAVSPDGQTAYLLSSETGALQRVRAEALKTPTALDEVAEQLTETLATHAVDMQASDDTGDLIIACDQPPRLIQYSLAGKTATTIDLPDRPSGLALSRAAQNPTLCVSFPSLRSVWIAPIMQGTPISASSGQLVEMNLAPNLVVAKDDQSFVTSDALGNGLARVHTETLQIEYGEIRGHHIGGLMIDRSNKQLIVAHQQLNPNARSDLDDLRWGSLIKNSLSFLSVPSRENMHKRIQIQTTFQLGQFGQGAADPAGVVSVGQRLAVALSGSNEVAVVNRDKAKISRVGVGRVPQKLFAFGDNLLLCVHRLDERVAVIDVSSAQPKMLRMLGPDPVASTAQERGRLAYYSAALSNDHWMSCNSCHVEGLSPGLTADTQSDGTFDTPKKIPSLENVTHTGPWGWRGTHATLREQIEKTLTNTMHAPDDLPTTGGLERSTVIDDLVAYLATLKSQRASSTDRTNTQDSAIIAGRPLFDQRCARCHRPDQYYTSDKTYDVGLRDERGNTEFNPPSLIGLRFRQRFMHDAGLTSLKEVFANHPPKESEGRLSEEQVEQLVNYLKTL